MTTICTRPTIVRIPSRNSNNATSPSIALNASIHGSPVAVPNKHIPFCSPGPQPNEQSRNASTISPSNATQTNSLLFPPNAYTKLSDRPPVYVIDGDQLHAALKHQASQPLPDPKLVFPWLHGLHPDNALQLSFFTTRRRAQRRSPQCLRSITIVKAGGNLAHSKLTGAVEPSEILEPSDAYNPDPGFLQYDPRQGFSVRNFHIQTAKLATLSDIVVYGDTTMKREDVRRFAEQVARAQRKWRDANNEFGFDLPRYNTFMLRDPFGKLEQEHPDIVAVDSDGQSTRNVIDFLQCERQEMHEMSTQTEIAHNVRLGPSADAFLVQRHLTASHEAPPRVDLLVEAVDGAPVPNSKSFRVLDTLLNASVKPKTAVPQLQFFASGSIVASAWSQPEVDSILTTCEWIYRQANGLQTGHDASSEVDDAARKRKDSRVDSAIDGDIGHAPVFESDELVSTPTEAISSICTPERSILLHCADGYTETTLLAVAYYMYVNCVPLHTAYIQLHKQLKRNFFAYSTDLTLLTLMQPRLLQASPAAKFTRDLAPAEPAWMSKCDGSLPSRITDYMYLGNVAHANNPGVLSELGIGQVLSVGEPVTWTDDESDAFSKSLTSTIPDGQNISTRLLYIDKIQDNGIDSLTSEIPRCLDFIERGRKAGLATLVHCRVGVSRSATICIAEVMKEHRLSFPRAYCFVRARRLNVIIQPHLRFSYELLKYEETLAAQRGQPHKRELEWSTIAREIAALNKPYCRQQ